MACILAALLENMRGARAVDPIAGVFVSPPAPFVGAAVPPASPAYIPSAAPVRAPKPRGVLIT
eukprot:4937990-Pyramimonas_sp.AAC.1